MANGDFANVGWNQTQLTRIETLLGADTADNSQASTLVAANADGSIMERLEYVQTRVNLGLNGTPATYNPVLGYRVTVTENVNTATGVNLFTLTGKVLITLWNLEVTNALHTTVTDYQIALTTLNGVILAAGDISSAAVGFMRNLNGDAGDTALSTSTGAVTVTGVADTNGKTGQLVVGKAGGSDVIKSIRTAGASGDEIKHVVFYWPLEASASLVAI